MKTLLNFLLLPFTFKLFTFFTFTFILLTLSLFSQPGNTKRTWHWYFGNYAGLDFSSGQAVADTNGQMTVFSGCATMSDTAGNLLMYTDGFSVWNSNHQIMENGAGLLPGGSTPEQNSVIVPLPGSDYIYYIFSLQAFGFKKSAKIYNSLDYAIVDMSYNGGLGKVISKNNHLLTPISEAIGAVHHRNGKDVWIMALEYGTNNFHNFLLTKYGISDTVITTIGNFAGTPYGAVGIRFSPNGKKMATPAFWNNVNNPTYLDTLYLFDFNNQTGVLSNPILLPDTLITPVAFSPDNSKIYYCNYNTNTVPLPCNIIQYDISSNNEATILSTMNIVYIPTVAEYPNFQITPDKTKLIALRNFQDTLAIVNNPNAYGIACDIVDNAIPLYRHSGSTLPNFISSYFNSDTTSYTTIKVEQILEKQKYNVYPNPFNTETNINTNNKTIEQYNLYDSKGSTISKDFFQLKKTDNSYLFTNKKLKGGLYFLNGTFTNKEVFSIQLLIY